MIETMRGLGVADIVGAQPKSQKIVETVTHAARIVAARGARCVVTSCGFLAQIQAQTAPQVSVPFIASSLLSIEDLVARGIRVDQIGVLTFNVDALTRVHFDGAGVPMPIARVGLPAHSHLRTCIETDATTLDLSKADADVRAMSEALRLRFASVRAVVLECTNLAPYRAAVQAVCGWEVIDICDTVRTRCPTLH